MTSRKIARVIIHYIWGYFVMKKLLALLLTVTLLMSVAATASAEWVRPVQTVETWDEEADFVIVGFGLAGAAAAVEAHDIDPEAKVVVLEKMPETLAGGNSIASGQTFIVPSENGVPEFKKYLEACNEPNPIPDEYLDWLVNGFAEQLPWIESVADSAGYEAGYVGGGELKWGSLVVEFDTFPGSVFEGTSAHLRKKNSGAFENGGVWRCFAEAAKVRGIEVRYENPAIALVQDPVTREVSGVVATDAEGNEYTIKSAKGVLLACGGYENNLEMQRDFHGMDEVYTAGTPGNTGDGIKMLMEAGAKIWHMKNQTQSGGFWLGIKVPEYESTFMRNFDMPGNSWIEVASDNTRFYNESYGYHRQHMKYMEYGRYVDLPHERALPVHLIFDESTREAGSIASQWLSWPTTTEGYTWSNDNLAEIEKGWIIKADTIEELAETPLNSRPPSTATTRCAKRAWTRTSAAIPKPWLPSRRRPSTPYPSPPPSWPPPAAPSAIPTAACWTGTRTPSPACMRRASWAATCPTCIRTACSSPRPCSPAAPRPRPLSAARARSRKS